MKSEGLANLVGMEANRQLENLPSLARRGLMKALVLVGSACEDQASRDQYWQKVLKPLGERFSGFVLSEDMKKVYNDDKVRHALESQLESFIGEEEEEETT